MGLKVWAQLCYDWRLKHDFFSMIISLKIACGLYSATAYIRKNTVVVFLQDSLVNLIISLLELLLLNGH